MINKNKAFTYFINEFEATHTTKGWYGFQCPFCGDMRARKKAAVNIQLGSVKCWVCGYKGSLVDFVMDYEGVRYFDAKDILNSCAETTVDLSIIRDIGKPKFSEVRLPEGFTPITEGEGIMGTRARNYLVGRGFDLEELDRIGIGYCSEQTDDPDTNFFGYIIIPFKRRGSLVYYIGRDYFGHFLRYKNPPTTEFNVGKSELVFNEDALDLYDECQVLEGWADATTIGRTATSTQGWNISPAQFKIYVESGCDALTFIPDAGADESGDKFYYKALRAAEKFLPYKKEIRVLDLNSLEGGKDVNEMGKDVVMDLRQRTPPLTTELIIKTLMYG